MEEKFKLYDWEFFVNPAVSNNINVYDDKTGDVIGYLTIHTTIPRLKESLKCQSELKIKEFIENNIEYY